MLGGEFIDNQFKQLVGSWIQAIGTVTSAIGSTPALGFAHDFQKTLDLWGNVMQGTGNALVAEGIESFSLGKLGNQIQAIGNSTVVAGILLNINDETKQLLIINGNWLQALGGSTALAENLEASVSFERSLSISGNALQVVGNSLQAIGGINELNSYEKKDENSDDAKSIIIIGSWIQAVGSVISAIEQTKKP